MAANGTRWQYVVVMAAKSSGEGGVARMAVATKFALVVTLGLWGKEKQGTVAVPATKLVLQ